MPTFKAKAGEEVVISGKMPPDKEKIDRDVRIKGEWSFLGVSFALGIACCWWSSALQPGALGVSLGIILLMAGAGSPFFYFQAKEGYDEEGGILTNQRIWWARGDGTEGGIPISSLKGASIYFHPGQTEVSAMPIYGQNGVSVGISTTETPDSEDLQLLLRDGTTREVEFLDFNPALWASEINKLITESGAQKG